MQNTKHYFLIKEHSAKVIEAIGCGVIIGVIAGLLVGVFITGNTDFLGIKYFMLAGATVGCVVTFFGGLIRDIRKIKMSLSERMKNLKIEEKVSLLAKVLEKELIPIKIWAIRELGKIGGQNAIFELRKAQESNSNYIRKEALEVLKKLNVEA